ncbi:MAG TPA: sigma-70 family RNA polymerase sigma factor [Planctomycetota bacterium]|jgi:RNA polymerase sigma-70 factor (ECF subfamily)|nr:sigma-70 family RNA polymerase sigma factor [Planctomycetota bacterium]
MEAFEILAEQFRPMVLAYLKTLTRDEHLAEDLTQETFIAAQKSLSQLRDGARFGTWLRGIARHKALDSRRAAARHPLIADDRVVQGMEEVYAVLDAPSPQAQDWADRVRILRECVSRLNGSLREAVLLVYEQGKSLNEGALALGLSFPAFAQRLHRARTLLEECITLRLKESRLS